MNAFPHIRYAVRSDVGRKRKNNEDSFGAFPAHGIFCVADGMGGGDDGEVAFSATIRAVETFVSAHPLPKRATYVAEDIQAGIHGALNTASRWILERSRNKHLKGCGSTFVGICFDASRPDVATALHAGDSRLYRIRGRAIQQFTKDHSAAELIGVKDEKDINPMFRGMILRAVGIQPVVELEATPVPIKEGDRILICSDGLYRMVPDKKMVALVLEHGNLDEAVASLVAEANAAGGVDNITVELIDVGPLPPARSAIPLPVDDVSTPRKASTTSAESHTRDTNGTGFGVPFDVESGDGHNSSGLQDETEPPTCATMTIPEAGDDDELDVGVLSDETVADLGDATVAVVPDVRDTMVVPPPKRPRRLPVRQMALVGAAVGLVFFGVVTGVLIADRRAANRRAKEARLAEVRRAAERELQLKQAQKIREEAESRANEFRVKAELRENEEAKHRARKEAEAKQEKLDTEVSEREKNARKERAARKNAPRAEVAHPASIQQ